VRDINQQLLKRDNSERIRNASRNWRLKVSSCANYASRYRYKNTLSHFESRCKARFCPRVDRFEASVSIHRYISLLLSTSLVVTLFVEILLGKLLCFHSFSLFSLIEPSRIVVAVFFYRSSGNVPSKRMGIKIPASIRPISDLCIASFPSVAL